MGIGNKELVHGLIHNPEAAPGSPTAGQTYYDSTANKMYFYNGTSWIDMSGGLSVAAVGSTPNANGASVAGQVLTLQPADGTHPGVLTSGAQTVGGAKTFSTPLALTNLAQASATNGQATVWDSVAAQWDAQNINTLAGFENQTDSTLAWNDGTRTFTISGTYNFWIQNIKFTKSSPINIVIPNTAGQYFVYFDSTGTLQQSSSVWDITSDLIAPVVTVYWSGTLGEVGDERHSAYRNRLLNSYLHNTRGTAYGSGLAGTFTNTTLSVTTGIIYDEDIKLTISGTQTACRLWWRSGSTNIFANAITAPYSATSTLSYDNAGTLTQVPNTNYVMNWVYATDDISNPISVVVGQSVSGSLTAIRASAQPTFPSISVREWKLLYSIIYQRNGASVSFIESADYRTVSTLPGTTTTSSLPAASITFTPTGNITSTNVQNALSELDTLMVHIAGTETVTGAKTFSSLVTTSLGITSASTLPVSSGLGAGATDVVTAAGSTVADVSVSPTAVLFSVQTGIGGSPAGKFWVAGNGDFRSGGAVGTGYRGQSASNGLLTIDDSIGAKLAWNSSTITCGGGISILAGGSSTSIHSATSNTIFSNLGAGASDVANIIGSNTADGSVNAAAKLLSIQTGLGGTPVESLSILKGGIVQAAGGVSKLTLNDAGTGAMLSYGGSQVYAGSSLAVVTASFCTLFAGSQNIFKCNAGAGSTDIVNYMGSTVADASVSPSAHLLSLTNGIGGTPVEKMYVAGDGTLSTVNTSNGWSVMGWYGVTTNATPTEIFRSGPANNRYALPNNSSSTFKLLVVARDNTNNVSKGWEVTGLIQRGANAAATSMDTVGRSIYQIGAGANTWDCVVGADTTNGSLAITVTGATSTTIHWSVKGDITACLF
jgi:hypothetical protein